MPFDGSGDRSDLNYLIFRRAVERTRASSAASAAARKANHDLAELYEQRIERVTAGKVRFTRRRTRQLVS